MVGAVNPVSITPTARVVPTAVTPRQRAGRIVVGVDGSASADGALDWAAEEALRRQATLEVVHTWMPPYPLGPQDLLADLSPLEDAAGGVLNDVVARGARRRSMPASITRTLPMGKAASKLVEAATGGDLLVVGTRGGGVLGLPIGSVSRQCITQAPCPVVVVGRAGPALEAARIVVGVDGSELSSRALRWAAREAVMRSAILEVVNARGPVRASAAAARRKSSSQSSSLALLDDMIDRALGDLVRQTSLVTRPMSGEPEGALVEAATHADLLVIGGRVEETFVTYCWARSRSTASSTGLVRCRSCTRTTNGRHRERPGATPRPDPADGPHCRQ